MEPPTSKLCDNAVSNVEIESECLSTCSKCDDFTVTVGFFYIKHKVLITKIICVSCMMYTDQYFYCAYELKFTDCFTNLHNHTTLLNVTFMFWHSLHNCVLAHGQTVGRLRKSKVIFLFNFEHS